MNIYPICIGSYKRGPFTTTFNYFKNTDLKLYCYVDKEDYTESGYDKLESNNIEFVFGPRYLAEKRNFIIQDQLKRGNDKIYMIDDDVYNFKYFIKGEKWNKGIKVEPEKYMEVWQSQIQENTVISGLAHSGYGGLIKLKNIENLNIDGVQFMNIKVLNDNDIHYNDKMFSNRDLILQMMEKRLPFPLKHNMLGREQPQADKVKSVIFQIVGNKWYEWAKNIYLKWGDLITIKKKDYVEGCYGVSMPSIKTIKNWPRDKNDKFIRIHNKYPEFLN